MADYSKYTREELEARLKLLEEENNLGLLFTDRFNSVLESASIGFWTYNVLTGAMDFSPSWYKMMGYTIEDFNDPTDLRGDMIHPEDSYYSEKFRQIIQTGDIPETDDKIRLRTKTENGNGFIQNYHSRERQPESFIVSCANGCYGFFSQLV